jgi:hypothetical protein
MGRSAISFKRIRRASVIADSELAQRKLSAQEGNARFAEAIRRTDDNFRRSQQLLTRTAALLQFTDGSTRVKVAEASLYARVPPPERQDVRVAC